MARSLKTYTVEVRDVVVNPEVVAALGEPPHRRQARVWIVASTKAAAVDLARPAMGFVSSRKLRLATGSGLDVMQAAGMLNQPRFYARASHLSAGPVVTVDAAGVRVVGQLQVTAGHRLVFVPVAGTTAVRA